MAKTELLKYQSYEDVFNHLTTGSTIEKLTKIANDYTLYRLKTGIDSPFESALMQQQQDNADWLGMMLVKSVKEIIGIPDETSHKGESLSTEGGIKEDTKWTPTLTTPSRLYKDLNIPDDPDVNHILAGPFDTNGFTLSVPAGTTVTIV